MLHEIVLYIHLCPILLILFSHWSTPIKFLSSLPHQNCSYQSSPQTSKLLYPEVTSQFSHTWPKAVLLIALPLKHILHLASRIPQPWFSSLCLLCWFFLISTTSKYALLFLLFIFTPLEISSSLYMPSNDSDSQISVSSPDLCIQLQTHVHLPTWHIHFGVWQASLPWDAPLAIVPISVNGNSLLPVIQAKILGVLLSFSLSLQSDPVANPAGSLFKIHPESDHLSPFPLHHPSSSHHHFSCGLL